MEGRTPERGCLVGLQFRSPEREVLRLLILVYPTGRTGTQFASAGG